MQTHTNNPISRFTRILVGLFVIALIGLFTPDQSFAQTTPEAGTLIGNQASATYTDGGGNSRTVTSNVVNTIVQQVGGVSVATAQTKQVSPGGQISFPHSITNDGNGTDSFNLTVTDAGDFTPTSINIYKDENNDGNPDDLNAITSTTNLDVGESYNVIVVVNVPNSVTTADVVTLTFEAESVFDNTVTDNLNDVIQISENAVINITKSMSSSSGNPGSGPHTVTLTYTNSGNNGATALVITDQLPTNMNYATGTGAWSETGTAMTDAAGGDPAGIAYDYNATQAGAVTVTIDNVGPGQSGTISFDVNIDAGATPGVLANTASYEYDNNGGSAGGNVGPFTSNTFNFTVLEDYDVSGTGETITSANQGATVTFTNTITNNGNATDTYNITVADGGSPFPAGTSYIVYKSDGVSPLLDTNSDGTPDTGPISPGGTYDVILKVTLPSGASGTGPFQYVKTATSINDGSALDTMTDQLDAIVGSTVDITADAAQGDAGALGEGTGPEGAAVKSTTTNPNSTVTFNLFVKNTSGSSDNYDLAISTASDFSSLTLPSGVSATFKDAGTGAVIGNTGTLNAGASKEITVEIQIPAGASPSTTSYYVRSLSPGTTAEDAIHLSVEVNTVRSVTITPNNSGQVYPGGSVAYTHTVKNNGNVDENTGSSTVTLGSTNSNAGFSAVIYRDDNGDGLIDTGEPIISTAGDLGTLSAGSSVQIIVKVSASPGVSSGLNNTTTVTVTPAGTVNSVAAPAAQTANDVTTVIDSNVSLVKKQSLDANNDGTPDNTYSSADVNAKPGEGIMYQVTIKNLGTDPVNSVVINDAIPPYTSYNSANAAGNLDNAGTVSFSSGTLTATVGTLAPGETVILTFGVTIDN